MTVKTVHSFSFLQRNQRRSRPVVATHATLPPRHIIEDFPDVLPLYDRFDNLQRAANEQSLAEGRLAQEAKAAEQDYHREAREVMAGGGDVAKVKNRAEALRDQSTKAGQLAKDARLELQAVGYELGTALATVAPQVVDRSEYDLGEATADVAAARDVLARAEAKWAAAWGVRRTFGHLHLFGGAVGSTTANVADVGDPLTALERLKAEEQWQRDFFIADDAAAAHNARTYGGSR